ncbi:MAG: hypothetical protein ACO1G5_00365 [Bacteroidota bacterium]|jgi:hypothetical protein
MKWYVDSIFRKIGETINEIENNLLLIEDEEYSAARFARQGAVIDDERWQSINERKNKFENQKKVLQFLKSQLHKHHNPGNSNKEKIFYQNIVEEEVIKKLASEENFEGCIIVKEFMKQFN